MKILHLSFGLKGGAGKNLERHHSELLRSGVQSRIFTAEDWRDRDEKSLTGLLREQVEWADLVELRQIHGGGYPQWISFKVLGKIASRRPIIWRFSDMWPFTGYCAYSLDCSKWLSGCGYCPQLSHETEKAEIWKPMADDTVECLEAKREFFRDVSLHVVCPSNWMKEQFLCSGFAYASVNMIPVGVNPAEYEIESKTAKQELGLSNGYRYILCNAPSPLNYRKGFAFLEPIFKNLAEKKNLRLLTTSRKDLPVLIGGIRVINLGFQESDQDMARVYAASDVFVFPSRMDNSPQVLVEASCAGLPIVAFGVGGNPEYLGEDDGDRLIAPYDCEAFANQVDILLKDESKVNAKKTGFTLHQQTSSFIELYSGLLKNAKMTDAIGKPK